MRNQTILVCLILILAVVPGCSNKRTSKEQTVLMIYRFNKPHDNEVAVEEIRQMLTVLEEAGFEVKMAAEFDNIKDVSDAEIQPTIMLSEVDSEDYVGVIIPCLGVSRAWIGSKKIGDIVIAAVKSGKPVAAQDRAAEIFAV